MMWVQRVFNPMTPQYELELHTRNYCGRDLLTILQQVTAKFANALVLVLGYYPALSHQSRPEGVEALFELVHGVKFAPLFDRALFRNEIVEHCLRFEAFHRIAVQRGGARESRSGSLRAVFVDSGMEEVMRLMRQSLLWS